MFVGFRAFDVNTSLFPSRILSSYLRMSPIRTDVYRRSGHPPQPLKWLSSARTMLSTGLLFLRYSGLSTMNF